MGATPVESVVHRLLETLGGGAPSALCAEMIPPPAREAFDTQTRVSHIDESHPQVPRYHFVSLVVTVCHSTLVHENEY